MKALCTVPIRAACATVLTLAACAALADDDIVADEPAPVPAVPAPAGRVIVMPGLRLQVGPGGALHIQGQGQVQFGGNAEPEAAKGPYLGVVTGAVSPQVRAQLDLPEGVGVAVEAVAEGSPAAKAGVRRHDVIRAFNDQVICSPEQLSTLVRLVGAGTEAPLAILRGGREQVLDVTIEEGAAPRAGAAAAPAAGPLQQAQVVPLDIPGLVAAAGGDLPEGVPDEVRRRLEAVLGRVQGAVPGGVAADVQTQVLTIGPNAATQSMTVVSDARGTLTLRESDGKRTVTIKDPAGTELHAGPLDTDADREAVPEEFRAWVAEVEKRATAGKPRVEPAPAANEPEEETEQPEAPAAEESRDTDA